MRISDWSSDVCSSDLHVLTIPADRFTPTDATSMPLGEHRSGAGTVFDFRQPTPVGARVREGKDEQIRYGRGYDHNWVVGEAVTKDQHLMARVTEPTSGRGFELWTNQQGQIGRASWRERVWQDVKLSVAAETLKKNTKKQKKQHT